MTDEERERLAAAFGSLRFAESDDDDGEEWFVTGDTTDGRPLQPFVTFDLLREGVDRIRRESGSPLGDAMAAHPEVAERLRREPEIVHEYTCGAVQAGAMVVRCATCGCVRQHDRPHDYVADLQLRGWFCYCGIFNGEEKERQATCRTCGVARPL